MGAAKSCRNGYLPIGLANDVTLKTHIVNGQYIRFSDVKINETSMAYKFRREMEAVFDSVGGLNLVSHHAVCRRCAGRKFIFSSVLPVRCMVVGWQAIQHTG